MLAGFANPMYQPATCSCPCSGTPSNAKCAYTSIYIYDNNTCNGSGMNHYVYPTTTCTPGGTVYANGGILDPYFYIAGTCAAPPVQVTKPAYSWAAEAIGCAPVSTAALGCSGGNVCLPRASAPFRSDAYCIEATGDVSCPVGPYATKYVYYGGATDMRACTPCECIAKGTCTSTYTGYTDASCGTPAAQLTNRAVPTSFSPSCAVTFTGSSTPASFKVTSETLDSASLSCVVDNSTGGQPVGTVMPDSPTTVCCTQ
jgi:hypothetical protein